MRVVAPAKLGTMTELLTIASEFLERLRLGSWTNLLLFFWALLAHGGTVSRS